MMKYRLWLCTIMYLCCTMVFFAQEKEPHWALQLKAGAGLSNVYVGSDENTTSDMKVGYQFGIYAEYVLPSDLFFQTGLIFESKGAKYKAENRNAEIIDYYMIDMSNGWIVGNQSVSVNAIYLQVPVYAGYKFDLNDNLSINIAAGPYLAYGVGGKATMDEVDAKENVVKTKKDVFGKDDWKRLDAGLTALLGAEYKKVSVNLGYDFGMVNIDRVYEVYNRNLFLNIGYRIF